MESVIVTLVDVFVGSLVVVERLLVAVERFPEALS